jgi:hypothetical protein
MRSLVGLATLVTLLAIVEAPASAGVSATKTHR